MACFLGYTFIYDQNNISLSDFPIIDPATGKPGKYFPLIALVAETGLMEWCYHWREWQKINRVAGDSQLKERSQRTLANALRRRIKDVRAAEKEGFALPNMPDIHD
mmetsp:Transcript_14853/g.21198  ORF Transcript_14853/g.21198 Transcript_14853/m.21198 type:complete len:106 (+) Transcript_14853:1586-1903(+)